MGVEELYKCFKECDTISIDSRQIENLVDSGKEVMFFAIVGDNFDGNDYAEKAIKQGARYAVVSRKPRHYDPAIIEVGDTLKTLQALAHHHRITLNIPIIAITGSNGKTTTKELLCAVLNKKYNISATVGNLNNHIGVPLTLLSLKEEHNIGIVEMGANHQGEIAMLANIASPNFGIITNIGKAHLEGFGGEEGIAKGKGELFSYLEKTGGTAIYNIGIDKLAVLAKKYTNLKKHTYSSDNFLCERGGDVLSVSYGEECIKTHLVGEYNIFNIASAFAIGELFDVEKKDIISALENYVPSNSRSQLIIKGDNKFIVDAYNANPSSMKLAIENLLSIDEKLSKVLILGDMKELGTYSLSEHIEILKLADNTEIAHVIFVGEEFQKALKEYAPKISHEWYATSEEAKKHIADYTHTLFLIKGSNSIRLGGLV